MPNHSIIASNAVFSHFGRKPVSHPLLSPPLSLPSNSSGHENTFSFLTASTLSAPLLLKSQAFPTKTYTDIFIMLLILLSEKTLDKGRFYKGTIHRRLCASQEWEKLYLVTTKGSKTEQN